MKFYKSGFLLFLTVALCSCAPLVPNLSEYKEIHQNAKYLVSSQNDSGFELSVYLKTDDFYTEKRRLSAEAKILFKDVAKLVCIREGKKCGFIDENTYLVNANVGQKEVQLINWVYYAAD